MSQDSPTSVASLDRKSLEERLARIDTLLKRHVERYAARFDNVEYRRHDTQRLWKLRGAYKEVAAYLASDPKPHDRAA